MNAAAKDPRGRRTTAARGGDRSATPAARVSLATPGSPATRTPRISGRPVPACVPATGAVQVLCIGEAPGPRGADKSGVPFFGDRAGLPLYRALVAAGCCTLPDGALDGPWDGARFAEAGWTPVLHGVALANAYDRCPTNDGLRFRAPTRRELESAGNLERLANEMAHVRPRQLRRVIALGAVAARTMHALAERHPALWEGVELHPVPHPSAQGLLSAAPDRGRGARLADLAAQWEAALVSLLHSARGTSA